MCKLCGGTQRLPFYKDGILRPDVTLFCECYREPAPAYYQYSDDLIDYPVSWDWHRHYQKYYNNTDPGSDRSSNEPEPKVVEIRVTNKQELNQIKGDLVDLRNKVNSITDKKKHTRISTYTISQDIQDNQEVQYSQDVQENQNFQGNSKT